VLIAFLVIFPVACGGDGEDSNDNYRTDDLQGTWNFVYSDSTGGGGQYELTFDNNGNLIEVALPPDSDDEIVEFGGALVLNSGGALLGTLQITVLVKESGLPDETVPMDLTFSGLSQSLNLIVGNVLIVDSESEQTYSFTMNMPS
jgi:hypothetical protein